MLIFLDVCTPYQARDEICKYLLAEADRYEASVKTERLVCDRACARARANAIRTAALDLKNAQFIEEPSL